MRYIKVSCEYDIGGQFGSNNNEEIFAVSDNLSSQDISALVLKRTQQVFDEVKDDLEEGVEDLIEAGLLSWEFIEVTTLDLGDL